MASSASSAPTSWLNRSAAVDRAAARLLGQLASWSRRPATSASSRCRSVPSSSRSARRAPPLGPGQHRVDVAAVGVPPGQPAQSRHPLLDRGQPGRVGVDLGGVRRRARSRCRRSGNRLRPAGSTARPGKGRARSPASRARPAAASSDAAFAVSLIGSSSPLSERWASSAASRRASAWVSRDSSVARARSSPGCGSTTSISPRPCRSSSASARRSWLRVRTSSSRACTWRSRSKHSPYAASGHGHLVPGVAVEQVALAGRGLEPDLVGLAVHGDQLGGELGQQADRNRTAAQVGPGATLAGDRAGDDEQVVVQLGAGLASPPGDRAERVDPDQSLDQRAMRSRCGRRRRRRGRPAGGPGR